MATSALCEPNELGVKVTSIVQVAFGPRLVGQLFVCANEVGFIPETEMPLMDNIAVPELVTKTGCAVLGVLTAVLGNESTFGLSVIAGAGVYEMPFKEALWGEFAALSMICSCPGRLS